MAEFRLSPAATRDMEDIWLYTRNRWGTEQANAYIGKIHAACTALAENPLRAPSCDAIRPGYRQRRVEHHVAYFRITPSDIAVIRILHERMDALRHL